MKVWAQGKMNCYSISTVNSVDITVPNPENAPVTMAVPVASEVGLTPENTAEKPPTPGFKVPSDSFVTEFFVELLLGFNLLFVEYDKR